MRTAGSIERPTSLTRRELLQLNSKQCMSSESQRDVNRFSQRREKSHQKLSEIHGDLQYLQEKLEMFGNRFREVSQRFTRGADSRENVSQSPPDLQQQQQSQRTSEEEEDLPQPQTPPAAAPAEETNTNGLLTQRPSRKQWKGRMKNISNGNDELKKLYEKSQVPMAYFTDIELLRSHPLFRPKIGNIVVSRPHTRGRIRVKMVRNPSNKPQSKCLEHIDSRIPSTVRNSNKEKEVPKEIQYPHQAFQEEDEKQPIRMVHTCHKHGVAALPLHFAEDNRILYRRCMCCNHKKPHEDSDVIVQQNKHRELMNKLCRKQQISNGGSKERVAHNINNYAANEKRNIDRHEETDKENVERILLSRKHRDVKKIQTAARGRKESTIPVEQQKSDTKRHIEARYNKDKQQGRTETPLKLSLFENQRKVRQGSPSKLQVAKIAAKSKEKDRINKIPQTSISEKTCFNRGKLRKQPGNIQEKPKQQLKLFSFESMKRSTTLDNANLSGEQLPSISKGMSLREERRQQTSDNSLKLKESKKSLFSMNKGISLIDNGDSSDTEEKPILIPVNNIYRPSILEDDSANEESRGQQHSANQNTQRNQLDKVDSNTEKAATGYGNLGIETTSNQAGHLDNSRTSHKECSDQNKQELNQRIDEAQYESETCQKQEEMMRESNGNESAKSIQQKQDKLTLKDEKDSKQKNYEVATLNEDHERKVGLARDYSSNLTHYKPSEQFNNFRDFQEAEGEDAKGRSSQSIFVNPQQTEDREYNDDVFQQPVHEEPAAELPRNPTIKGQATDLAKPALQAKTVEDLYESIQTIEPVKGDTNIPKQSTSLTSATENKNETTIHPPAVSDRQNLTKGAQGKEIPKVVEYQTQTESQLPFANNTQPELAPCQSHHTIFKPICQTIEGISAATQMSIKAPIAKDCSVQFGDGNRRESQRQSKHSQTEEPQQTTTSSAATETTATTMVATTSVPVPTHISYNFHINIPRATYQPQDQPFWQADQQFNQQFRPLRQQIVHESRAAPALLHENLDDEPMSFPESSRFGEDYSYCSAAIRKPEASSESIPSKQPFFRGNSKEDSPNYAQDNGQLKVGLIDSTQISWNRQLDRSEKDQNTEPSTNLPAIALQIDQVLDQFDFLRFSEFSSLPLSVIQPTLYQPKPKTSTLRGDDKLKSNQAVASAFAMTSGRLFTEQSSLSLAVNPESWGFEAPLSCSIKKQQQTIGLVRLLPQELALSTIWDVKVEFEPDSQQILPLDARQLPELSQQQIPIQLHQQPSTPAKRSQNTLKESFQGFMSAKPQQQPRQSCRIVQNSQGIVQSQDLPEATGELTLQTCSDVSTNSNKAKDSDPGVGSRNTTQIAKPVVIAEQPQNQPKKAQLQPIPQTDFPVVKRVSVVNEVITQTESPPNRKDSIRQKTSNIFCECSQRFLGQDNISLVCSGCGKPFSAEDIVVILGRRSLAEQLQILSKKELTSQMTQTVEVLTQGQAIPKKCILREGESNSKIEADDGLSSKVPANPKGKQSDETQGEKRVDSFATTIMSELDRINGKIDRMNLVGCQEESNECNLPRDAVKEHKKLSSVKEAESISNDQPALNSQDTLRQVSTVKRERDEAITSPQELSKPVPALQHEQNQQKKSKHLSYGSIFNIEIRRESISKQQSSQMQVHPEVQPILPSNLGDAFQNQSAEALQKTISEIKDSSLSDIMPLQSDIAELALIRKRLVNPLSQYQLGCQRFLVKKGINRTQSPKESRKVSKRLAECTLDIRSDELQTAFKIVQTYLNKGFVTRLFEDAANIEKYVQTVVWLNSHGLFNPTEARTERFLVELNGSELTLHQSILLRSLAEMEQPPIPSDTASWLQMITGGPATSLKITSKHPEKIWKILKNTTENPSRDRLQIYACNPTTKDCICVRSVKTITDISKKEVKLVCIINSNRHDNFICFEEFLQLYSEVVFCYANEGYYIGGLAIPPKSSTLDQTFFFNLHTHRNTTCIISFWREQPHAPGKVRLMLYFQNTKNHYKYQGKCENTSDSFYFQAELSRGHYLLIVEGLSDEQYSGISTYSSHAIQLQAGKWMLETNSTMENQAQSFIRVKEEHGNRQPSQPVPFR